MNDVPVLAMTRLGDVVASNSLGHALFPDLFPNGEAPMNHGRYMFLDERSRTFYPDWESTARDTVSAMRLLAEQDPSDRALMALAGELATRSPDFRKWWAGHSVRTHSSGSKQIHHPVVGDLTVGYEVLALPSTPGVSLLTYLTEPGSPSDDAMNVLRSWSAPDAVGRRTRMTER